MGWLNLPCPHPPLGLLLDKKWLDRSSCEETKLNELGPYVWSSSICGHTFMTACHIVWRDFESIIGFACVQLSLCVSHFLENMSQP